MEYVHLKFIYYIYIYILDINTLAYLGRPPLVWACLGGNIQIVKFLIENGAELNYVNEQTCHLTPLMAACQEVFIYIYIYISIMSALIGAPANCHSLIRSRGTARYYKQTSTKCTIYCSYA